MELTADTTVARALENRGPRVTETHWGYVIHEDVDRFERETLAGAAVRFAGLILVLSAYGQWLLPAALYGPDTVVTKSLVSLLLGLSGVALYWIASRSTRIDLQVDLTRRELRLTETSGHGRERLRAVVPMARVASAFVARTNDGTTQPQLFLEMRDRDDVMHVATGAESELIVLHRRLSHDLRPIEDRIDRKLAMAVPFRSNRAGDLVSLDTVHERTDVV